jgi:ketosteroid isomerase-like protein
MSRSDRLRQGIEALNARDFVAAAGDFAEDLRFHAPGLGLDVEGRDTVMKHVSEFVQQADVHYELEQVVEHGPFVVAFAQSTGTLDGRRVTWDLCEVLRYEGDEAAEVWVVRGGPPTPTSA